MGIVRVISNLFDTLGIGSFDPTVAFPVMMESCVTLMPVWSVKFIKEGCYPRKASLLLELFADIGVFFATYIVESLLLDILRWLVIAVIFYTSISMLILVNKGKGSKEDVIVENSNYDK